MHGVKKGLDERIDEGVLQCFGHVARMESDRIAKGVYVGECALNGSTLGDCLPFPCGESLLLFSVFLFPLAPQ